MSLWYYEEAVMDVREDDVICFVTMATKKLQLIKLVLFFKGIILRFVFFKWSSSVVVCEHLKHTREDVPPSLNLAALCSNECFCGTEGYF